MIRGLLGTQGEAYRDIGVGIVGLGQMGVLHAALSSSIGAKVRSICDNESFLIRIAKKVLPGVNFYSDYSEMVEREDLEAVFICTPANTHLKITSDVIKRAPRMSVFVEKPLATSYEESLRMVDAAKVASGVTMVGFQKRFAGVFKKAKELVSNGALGEIKFFRSHFLGAEVMSPNKGWKYAKGSGGATLEYGVHLLDLINWILGEPVMVQAFEKSIFSRDVEDFVNATVTLDDGVQGTVEVGWSMRNYQPAELMLEIHGSRGSLNATEDRLRVKLDCDTLAMRQGTHSFHSSSLNPPVPFLMAHPESVLQEAHFLDSVRAQTSTSCDFVEGAKANKFVDMIHGTSTD